MFGFGSNLKHAFLKIRFQTPKIPPEFLSMFGSESTSFCNQKTWNCQRRQLSRSRSFCAFVALESTSKTWKRKFRRQAKWLSHFCVRVLFCAHGARNINNPETWESIILSFTFFWIHFFWLSLCFFGGGAFLTKIFVLFVCLFVCFFLRILNVICTIIQNQINTK